MQSDGKQAGPSDVIGQPRPVWVCARRARQVDYPVALGDGGYITDDLRRSFWFCCPSSAPSADLSRLDISRRQCPATFSLFLPSIREWRATVIAVDDLSRSCLETGSRATPRRESRSRRWRRTMSDSIRDRHRCGWNIISFVQVTRRLKRCTKLITGHVAMVFG